MEGNLKNIQTGWVKPSGGAKYADVSLKVFRGMLRNGLRHIRLPNGRILTKFDWIDAYLKQFEVQSEDQSARGIAEEILAKM